jgi:hypothetical protein
MRKAGASTTGRRCQFSDVSVIFGSTGRMFANGCGMELAIEQKPSGRTLAPTSKLNRTRYSFRYSAQALFGKCS